MDMISQDFVLFRKKLEKVLGKLTELDNQLFLHIDLYNVDTYYERFQNKDEYPIATLLEKSKIEGKVSLDSEFWKVLEELIRKIAPKFADSPVMAMVPLLGSLDCDIE